MISFQLSSTINYRSISDRQNITKNSKNVSKINTSNELILIHEDDKIVGKDSNGNLWTLGEVRRFPVNEKYHRIPFNHLPPILPLYDKNSIIKRNNLDSNHIIIYNRVSKTGSTSIQKLLNLQSRNQQFYYISSTQYWERDSSIQNERQFVKFLKNINHPTGPTKIQNNVHILSRL